MFIKCSLKVLEKNFEMCEQSTSSWEIMLHEKSCYPFTKGASKDNKGLLRGSSTFCYFVWWIALTGTFLERPISKQYVC